MKLKKLLGFVIIIDLLLLAGAFIYIQRVYDIFDYSVIVAIGLYKFSLCSSLVALSGYLLASKIRKLNVKIISLFVMVLTVLFGIVFTVDSYKKYDDYVESSNGSHISGTYKTEKEIKELLPYYDYFYNEGGENADYSVSMFKSNYCTNISIDNQPYLMINNPYYEAELYSTEFVPVKLKIKSEMLNERNLSGKVELYKAETNENDVSYVVYEDDSGYAIEMSRKSDISQIVFDNIDKEKFNIEKFIEVSIQQFELLCELKEKDTVPSYQQYYSEELK